MDGAKDRHDRESGEPHQPPATMKKLLLCAITLQLAVSLMASGSGEGVVGMYFEETTLNTADAGYRFRISTDKEGDLTRIGVEWEGHTFDFSTKHFGEVKRAYVRGVVVKSPTVYSTGRQERVIIVLPYNRGTVEAGGEEREQWDVIRLYFHKGKLERWDRAEAIQGQPGKWKLSNWGEMEGDFITEGGEVKGPVFDQGEHTGKENPFSAFTIVKDNP